MTPLMIALKNHKRVEAIVNSLITTKGADLNLTDKVFILNFQSFRQQLSSLCIKLIGWKDGTDDCLRTL